MASDFSIPATCSEFLASALAFRQQIEAFKNATTVADYGWYPYGSLSVVPLLGDLLAEEYQAIADLLRTEPVADIGCGDGDLALLLARMGVEVHAIDHAESNFNQMRGVETLSRDSGGRMRAFDVDLDHLFDLPARQYGLILFLGTLYHLKNPFCVLERLAARTAYCVISTRIAQTVRGLEIGSEALAYLLTPREANNDPTNYWIFSRTGLMRLLDRTGWIVMAERRVGCTDRSDPVNADADERIYLLLKSRRRFPDLHVRPLWGWHEVEEGAWRWTMKQFAIEVILPETPAAREFALRFVTPETVVAQTGPIAVECFADGASAGRITCERPGAVEFRGVFREPEAARVVLEFVVDSSFSADGDRRDLGVIVPLLESGETGTHRIPFRIS